ELQAKWFPEIPRLYSLRGYQYCELLLSCAEPEDGSGLESLDAASEGAQRFGQVCEEVRACVEEAFEKRGTSDSLLTIALEHLSLGRSYLGQALTAAGLPSSGGKVAGFVKAAEHLDHAVEGLRQAGQEVYIPSGLLARATFLRLRGQLAR